MNYFPLATELGIKGLLSGNELRARCPLHSDKSPSFSVNVNTGLWTCFAGCGSGDFIRLVELVLNCSPQEAHDWVRAGKATTIEQISKAIQESLNRYPPEPEQPENLLWRLVYEQTDNRYMPDWFLNRGFTWQTIFRWGIHYDLINDAVIVPVYWKGELVGTITRNTSQFLPKYQNSPKFPGSKILFGEIFGTHTDIIICEGVLDTLWLWQLGYNAVGLLGSHISQEQIDILREYKFGQITLCLDNDKAGIEGTRQVFSKLTRSGWLLPQIKIIQFPPGKKDAQDCTAEEFAQLMGGRKDVIYGI